MNAKKIWAKKVESACGQIISKPEAFRAGYYGFVFFRSGWSQVSCLLYARGFKQEYKLYWPIFFIFIHI
ncbi:hypothetical protein [Cytophaga aurantiaca]|uniref:hypothetical protein n=1 Tax=Cytophaga aurantiaca TaxID=29530 RepID=UPI00036A61D4|nr:hypothetical protein [Cytophaga aurantiaca]